VFQLEGIDHVAIAVRNVPRSVDWYRTVLCLERRHEDVWGDCPAIVGIGTTALALFPVSGGEPAPLPGRNALAMRHVAFRATAANFAGAQHALTRLGIAFEFQDHRIAHSIYLSDPDGHQIEITTYDIG
jgi:catechol 2,3-dioxygenase-like lactoylglutathione lyase family enzyme